MSKEFTRRAVIQASIVGFLSNLGLESIFGATSTVTGKISQVSNSSITVTATANSAVRVYLEYGFAKGKYTSKTAIETLQKLTGQENKSSQEVVHHHTIQNQSLVDVNRPMTAERATQILRLAEKSKK
jgi:hypothetical protein